MSGIVGINRPNSYERVNEMLDRISYRGGKTRHIFSTKYSTFGIITNFHTKEEIEQFEKQNFIMHNLFDIHYAKASEVDSKIKLERDPLGVVPLYFCYVDNSLYFSSEIKSLIPYTKEIYQVKPGTTIFDGKVYSNNTIKPPEKFLDDTPDKISKTLRIKLENAIKKRIYKDIFGSWLSGGIDSSIITAISKLYVNKLYTFFGGIKDSTDLKYAKLLAEHIKSNHIEVIINLEDILKNLNDIIYHLESFDAYLVRSTLVNYIISKKARDYVEDVFSGEGSDELFAGYDYLKNLSIDALPQELLNITKALSNTALQRVDRSAFGNGLIAHLPFLDPDVVTFALSIPPHYKINNGIEKWILREATKDILPEGILNRRKEKFWQGAGIKEMISQYAETKISDSEFLLNRKLKNGFIIRSKEEYLYYSIFKEHFGELENFDLLGFTNITNS